MTMELKTGCFVFSKAGRDKGSACLVVGFDKKNALIADGKAHGIGNPKKKNPLHLQPVNAFVSEELQQKLKAGTLRDEEIRRALRDWEEKSKGSAG